MAGGLLHQFLIPGPRQWGIVGGDDLARRQPDDAQGAAINSSLVFMDPQVGGLYAGHEGPDVS